MENDLSKYFADELTLEERKEFLVKVNEEDELREEFIENQQLVAFVDWLSPVDEDEKKLAQQKLSEFMGKMESTKNK